MLFGQRGSGLFFCRCKWLSMTDVPFFPCLPAMGLLLFPQTGIGQNAEKLSDAGHHMTGQSPVRMKREFRKHCFQGSRDFFPGRHLSRRSEKQFLL